MSVLKIKKYKKKTIEEDIPDQTWEQVDNNPTALAILLVTIGDLETGESITITKK